MLNRIKSCECKKQFFVLVWLLFRGRMKLKLNLFLNPIWWIAIALIGKLALVGCLQFNRSQPLEADDAYSYLLHARTLFDDGGLSSPAQAPFKVLQYYPVPKTDAQNLENRLYHRVIYYYHNAHAALLRVMNLVVNDYDLVWWIHLYLFTVAWTLLTWQIAKKLVPATPLMAWIGSVFIFLSVAHQLTAAPREWVNLAFLAMIALWVSLPAKPRYGQLILAAFIACATVNTHPLGRVVTAMVLALVASEAVLEHWYKKVSARRSIQVGIALLIGWIVGEISSRYLFPHIESPTYSAFRYRSWNDLGDVILNDWLAQALRTQPLPFSKALSRALLIVSTILGMVTWVRQKQTLLVLWGLGMFLSILLLTFYGQLYALPNSYYWFHTYLYSVFFFVIALAAGTCWGQILASLPARWASALALIFLVVYFNIGARRSFKAYQYWVDRNNFESPRLAFEELRKIGAPGQCVTIHSESLLYEYLLTADLGRPVSFRFDCNGSYDLKGAPIVCPYRLRPRTDECRYNYQVAWQNRDWALDCVGEVCQRKP